jgi:hypothetical protein
VRRILIDRPMKKDDVEPGFFGYSTYWEGDTLVAETVGIKEEIRYQERAAHEGPADQGADPPRRAEHPLERDHDGGRGGAREAGR